MAVIERSVADLEEGPGGHCCGKVAIVHVISYNKSEFMALLLSHENRLCYMNIHLPNECKIMAEN